MANKNFFFYLRRDPGGIILLRKEHEWKEEDNADRIKRYQRANSASYDVGA